MEKLGDDYVMVGRVAAILRGLGYAVKHKPSASKLWAPQARELLKKHDGLVAPPPPVAAEIGADSSVEDAR